MKAEPEQAAKTDAELIAAVARGDEALLADLYDRYSATLFGLLLRILHSRPEAEDVLQEVFMQIWQQAPQYDEGRGRPFTWMMTIAHSRALDRLRSLASRNRTAQSAALEQPEEASDAARDAVNAEQREMIQRALEEIPEAQRNVLLLAYFQGLTQAEIAERLQEPLGTIKTRTRTGLAKLRECLRGTFGNVH